MEPLLGIIFIGIFVWILLKKPVEKKPEHNIVIKTEYSAPNNNYDDSDESVNEEKDNWERFNFYGAQTLPAQGRYRITYTDQRGLTTKREITVKRAYDDEGKFALDAHCHLRNGHRSFIDDRIQNAVDLDTGEVVTSVAQHAIAQYEGSGTGKAWKAIGREINALYILVFVCRADGRMLKAERTVILDYLKRWCHDIELDDNELDGAIKTLGTVDYRQFKRIIADMKSNGDIDRLRDIYDCAQRIIATQKTIDPLEKAALEILQNAVNEKAPFQASATT